MRNRLFLILFAFAFIGIAGQASAQGVLTPQVQVGFLAGPVGGVNLVTYNSDAFPILSSEPTCFLAQNGSDVAAWGGISLEFPLGNAQALQNFIVGEVIYDSKSSKFTNTNGGANATPTKLNGFVDNNSSVTTALDASLSYLVVNLAYKYNFTPGPSPVGPGIMIGPSIGIKMSANFNKTVTVSAISPNASAANPNLAAVQTVTNSSAITTANALRISLRAAATYDISFSNDWIATPVVGYDFPITKVDPTENWRASALFGGIAIRYFIRG
ncbi:MAG TPA: hypothetical protein VFH95_04265 [Candidatus Kapabacteria bacterium]|nr:hypothetical protein [Candidatus Kapabacteria bacterium]